MKKLSDYISEAEQHLAEKAKSQAQQKFMGMVHAAQKGEKAASPEVAKVAKGMSKSDAADFAKTKHKGLPKKIDEVSLGDYARKASKSKALAQMGKAFGEPGQETTIQSRTKGLERAAARSTTRASQERGIAQAAHRASEGSSKDKLEAQLKDLQSQFDPMYDRSDDHTYWTKHKNIAAQIQSLKKRLAAIGESTIVESSGDDQTLGHILGRFKHEVKKFKDTGTLDDDLFDDLFDYYKDAGEMPYGISKAKSGDPYEWVADQLDKFLKEKDLEEAVDPIDIPAYQRKSNGRLGTIQPPTAPPVSKRLVSPMDIPAVQRKASGSDFPLKSTQLVSNQQSIKPTPMDDGSMDILRKMAGLPRR